MDEILRNDIVQGTFRPGDAVPTEHDLMLCYNLSSTTVWRAVGNVVLEGWIYRKADRGAFVKRAKLEERPERLTSFAEEMQSRNITPQFKLVRAELSTPPYDVRQALKLSAHQQTYLIDCIQIANGEPIAVACGHGICDIRAQLVKQDLNRILSNAGLDAPASLISRASPWREFRAAANDAAAQTTATIVLSVNP